MRRFQRMERRAWNNARLMHWLARELDASTAQERGVAVMVYDAGFARSQEQAAFVATMLRCNPFEKLRASI